MSKLETPLLPVGTCFTFLYKRVKIRISTEDVQRYRSDKKYVEVIDLNDSSTKEALEDFILTNFQKKSRNQNHLDELCRMKEKEFYSYLS